MNTQKLIQEAKARFKHHESKLYLAEKYKNMLTFAHSGGLWTATPELITFLTVSPEQITLKDDFGIPIRVTSKDLLEHCWKVYTQTMDEWLQEYNNLQNLR